MSWIDEKFPNAVGRYRLTSDPDPDYNCIAFAAGVTDEWWSHAAGYPWPAPRSPLVESLVAVFKSLGYMVCDDATIEPGFERVAIYTEGGIWTHAAWQTPSGQWASKLGVGEDIEHDTPERPCGDTYGNIHCFMRRPSPADHVS